MMKDKKGMTLVEVIVSLTIMLVIIGLVISVLIPTANTFFRQEELTETNMIARNVISEIRGYVRNSAEIGVVNGYTMYFKKNKVGTPVEVKSDSAGMLTIGTMKPFGDDYYKGRKINLTFQSPKANKVKMILVIDNKGQKYTTETVLATTVGGFS